MPGGLAAENARRPRSNVRSYPLPRDLRGKKPHLSKPPPSITKATTLPANPVNLAAIPPDAWPHALALQ